MYATTISTKYQEVIPLEIRKQFGLKPGRKVVFIPRKKTLRMVIVPPIEEAEGFLQGIDTDVQREEEDIER
ncbi:MAG: AbrB/MazE/SpoVT family DNA-binding domain-containing protein [Chloroflexota bacterium]